MELIYIRQRFGDKGTSGDLIGRTCVLRMCGIDGGTDCIGFCGHLLYLAVIVSD